MKAVVFKDPFKLSVEEVDDPKIEQPLDAVIRFTTATSTARTYIPSRAVRRWTRGWCSGKRTWATLKGPARCGAGQVGVRVSLPFNVAGGDVPQLPRGL